MGTIIFPPAGGGLTVMPSTEYHVVPLAQVSKYDPTYGNIFTDIQTAYDTAKADATAALDYRTVVVHINNDTADADLILQNPTDDYSRVIITSPGIIENGVPAFGIRNITIDPAYTSPGLILKNISVVDILIDNNAITDFTLKGEGSTVQDLHVDVTSNINLNISDLTSIFVYTSLVAIARTGKSTLIASNCKYLECNLFYNTEYKLDNIETLDLTIEDPADVLSLNINSYINNVSNCTFNFNVINDTFVHNIFYHRLWFTNCIFKQTINWEDYSAIRHLLVFKSCEFDAPSFSIDITKIVTLQANIQFLNCVFNINVGAGTLLLKGNQLSTTPVGSCDYFLRSCTISGGIGLSAAIDGGDVKTSLTLESCVHVNGVISNSGRKTPVVVKTSKVNVLQLSNISIDVSPDSHEVYNTTVNTITCITDDSVSDNIQYNLSVSNSIIENFEINFSNYFVNLIGQIDISNTRITNLVANQNSDTANLIMYMNQVVLDTFYNYVFGSTHTDQYFISNTSIKNIWETSWALGFDSTTSSTTVLYSCSALDLVTTGAQCTLYESNLGFSKTNYTFNKSSLYDIILYHDAITSGADTAYVILYSSLVTNSVKEVILNDGVYMTCQFSDVTGAEFNDISAVFQSLLTTPSRFPTPMGGSGFYDNGSYPPSVF